MARRPVAAPRRRHHSRGRRQGDARAARAWPQAIRAVIADAIEAGGSSLRDHIQTDGSLGYFQHSFSVYDREGEPAEARLQRHHPAHRAERPLDLLLPVLPALELSEFAEPVQATDRRDLPWPMKRSSSKRAARSG